MNPKVSAVHRIMILLAPGFEEAASVYCLTSLREAGLSVSLVGLTSGLIKGFNGLAVRPDCTLDELPSAFVPHAIIVPGSEQCAALLLVDPRVHQLFSSTIANGGFVAALSAAECVLMRAGIPTPADSAHFIAQNGRKITEFSEALIDLML